jgi:predicted nucleotidyltransferase
MLADREQHLAEFGVKQIGLFGSYLRNEATINSDIDLLVDISRERKTFRNFMALNYYLEDLFGCKVELVTKQSLSPYIGPHILKTVEYVPIAG